MQDTKHKKAFFTLSPKIGDETLLAPRGVYFANDILVVSDTGQNRVFIWKKFDFTNREPDVVLGQENFAEKGRNSNTGAVSASTLQYPSGVWTDGKKLMVADAWNHRVLVWNELPTRNGQAADVVIGQENFTGNEPNVKGLLAKPSAQSLYWCYGLVSDGKSLWIADTGNRRVLFYEKIPTQNFAKADKVIGQENFEEKDYNNQNAIWPYSVKLSADNALAIVDTQYYRVLLWKNKDDAFSKQADIIFGQKDFESNGQNQFRGFPAANTLNWVYDLCFYDKGIFITDTGNSRVLRWKNLPTVNNAAADELIGQPNFETNGESSLSMFTKIENEMYWAFAVNVCQNILLVADTGNHRILFYKI